MADTKATVTIEEWAPIKWGYEISTLGNIRSLKLRGRKWPNSSLSYKFLKKNIQPIGKGSSKSGGYEIVCLQNKGEKEWRYVHQLVLETFIGTRPDGYEACHINSIRHDNRLSNLKWGTKQENCSHREALGKISGSNNPFSKLVEDDVWAIIALRRTADFKVKDLMDIFNVSKSCIEHILSGRHWKHVLEEYENLYGRQ